MQKERKSIQLFLCIFIKTESQSSACALWSNFLPLSYSIENSYQKNNWLDETLLFYWCGRVRPCLDKIKSNGLLVFCSSKLFFLCRNRLLSLSLSSTHFWIVVVAVLNRNHTIFYQFLQCSQTGDLIWWCRSEDVKIST